MNPYKFSSDSNVITEAIPAVIEETVTITMPKLTARLLYNMSFARTKLMATLVEVDGRDPSDDNTYSITSKAAVALLYDLKESFTADRCEDGSTTPNYIEVRPNSN